MDFVTGCATALFTPATAVVDAAAGAVLGTAGGALMGAGSGLTAGIGAGATGLTQGKVTVERDPKTKSTVTKVENQVSDPPKNEDTPKGSDGGSNKPAEPELDKSEGEAKDGPNEILPETDDAKEEKEEDAEELAPEGSSPQ